MIKTSVIRYAAIGMASLSLAGFAAASTVTVGGTGADSNQHIGLHNSNKVSTHNNNAVGVTNVNTQGAASGHVSAYKNNKVDGDAGSGDAANESTTETTVGVANGGDHAGSSLGALAGMGAPDDEVNIHDTGADSNQHVNVSNTQSVKVNNTNTVEVNNVNVQGAKSGNVNATKNTSIGGSVTSGAASNTSTATTTVNVSN